MKQSRGLKILTKVIFMMFVFAVLLPSSVGKSASTILMPDEVIRITVADPAYFTNSVGQCMYHDGGVGFTICEDVWLRAFRINGSGIRFNFWTDTTRRGFLQIWVDGVLYHNLTFDYYGTRNPEVTGLAPGIHEVVLRVDNTVCASASSVDCYEYPGSGRPDSFYFNNLTVLGPGDMDPPTNPTSATETHGVVDGIWQNTINTPEFTWSAGTDATSGVAGYEVYFGNDPNGTSTDFQTGTAYTTAAPYADGTYYLRLRTKDNAENYASWVTLFTFNVDTTPPVIATSRTGVPGAAGWWVSPFDLSAIITDAHSGVASSSLSLDGGIPQPVTDLHFSTEGTYQVVYAAADNAGNSAEQTENVRLDILAPVLHYDIATAGLLENGWYNKPVIVVAQSTDAVSGLAYDEIEIDGSGTWVPNVTLNTSGIYTIRQRAGDAAGHSIQSTTIPPDTIQIDVDRPTQTILLAPSQGQVISNSVMDFVGNSTDSLSGMASVQYQVEGGTWQTLTIQPTGNWEFQVSSETLEDGLRTIAIRTTDTAGNIESWQVQVDVHNPKPAAPVQAVIRIFSKPIATPMPTLSPTPFPTPTPEIKREEEPQAPAAAPVIASTPALMPTAQPIPVIYEGKAAKPINVSVGLSALPITGLLAATVFLYDPRPAQLKKFAKISRKAVPDARELKEMISFVSGTLTQSRKIKGDK